MNILKRIYTAAFLLGLLSSVSAQQISWVTIENLPQQSNGKYYIVDFYTSWCGYCKKMDRETFTHPTVAKIINNYYIPVKFNAEGNSTFIWQGIKYSATPTPPGSRPSVHMFTKAVLGKQIGFPSFAFFTGDQSLITIVQGYHSAEDFIIILWYFASGDNKRYSFDKYKTIFDKEIRPVMNRTLKIEK